MGDYGLDKWCYRMEEHKRKGHRINKYAESKVNDLNITNLKKIKVM